MGIDYYGVLNLKRTCTDLEIKMAYRRLGLQFNPKRLRDKCVSTVFNLVGEAYDVLSNPLTRAVFDQYGEEGLKAGVPGPDDFIQPYVYHGDGMKTYLEFYGTESPYANLLDVLAHPIPIYDLQEGKGMKRKGPPIKHPLHLTLHELFFGGIKKMKIQRLVFQDETETTTVLEEKILNIPIKPGLPPGTEIVFPEEGDQGPTQIPCDIIFITEDRPHPTYKRVGNNLEIIYQVNLKDALVGFTVTIHTIDDRSIDIPVTDVVSPDYVKVVENEGMPIVGTTEKGDLHIKFNIQFPSYVPKASRSHIRRGFSLAKIEGGPGEPEFINKLILADKMKRIDVDEQKPPN